MKQRLDGADSPALSRIPPLRITIISPSIGFGPLWMAPHFPLDEEVQSDSESEIYCVKQRLAGAGSPLLSRIPPPRITIFDNPYTRFCSWWRTPHFLFGKEVQENSEREIHHVKQRVAGACGWCQLACALARGPVFARRTSVSTALQQKGLLVT